MADKKDNRLLEEITPRDVDFTQWYTDIVKKAELADYSGIKGCMVVYTEYIALSPGTYTPLIIVRPVFSFL